MVSHSKPGTMALTAKTSPPGGERSRYRMSKPAVCSFPAIFSRRSAGASSGDVGSSEKDTEPRRDSTFSDSMPRKSPAERLTQAAMASTARFLGGGDMAGAVTVEISRRRHALDQIERAVG